MRESCQTTSTSDDTLYKQYKRTHHADDTHVMERRTWAVTRAGQSKTHGPLGYVSVVRDVPTFESVCSFSSPWSLSLLGERKSFEVHVTYLIWLTVRSLCLLHSFSVICRGVYSSGRAEHDAGVLCP